MSFKLTKSDYIKILKYYNLNIPKTNAEIKNAAENILSDKLCSCIKKVSPTNEPKAIGICSKTIFNRKNLSHGKFNCKKSRNIVLTKKSKNIHIPHRQTRKNK